MPELHRACSDTIASVPMHSDELTVDVETVRLLIGDQFPEWSDLPVTRLATAATVNFIFRVGEDLTARFPMRGADPSAARLVLESEVAAAREFRTVACVPCPEPIALGEPGRGYPLPWAVHSWVPGVEALEGEPAGSVAFASDLASLILRLRAADTRGRRFSRSGRGGGLRTHDKWIELGFANSQHLVDVPRLRKLWGVLRSLPVVDNDVLCHGDLTPTNVLVGAGRMVGVLDTGGFSAADPALDLVSVWHLLDAEPRQLVRRELACGDVQWLRGMAWALEQAMGLVWYYEESNPTMSKWGLRTLERLLLVDPS